MATPSLQLGSGNWAVKSDSLLGYALPQGKYTPREFTVTRTTTATRVNSAGLVELVPYNLLQYSEQFDNASWTKTNSTLVPNTTIAPDGKLTADTLTRVSGTGLIFQTITQVIGTTYAYSIWLKGSSAGNVILGTSSGSVFSTIAITTSWQRYTFTRVAAGTSDGLAIYLTAATLQSVDIWGAQLVEGTYPLTYLPTTTRLNIPRIDYSTGSANLLLEPQRTNLVLQSEQFDLTTPWTTNISGTGVAPTRTANSVISPSGIQNADTILFNRGAGNTSSDFCLLSQGITVATTGTYYFTCWMKATTSGDVGKQVLLRCGNSGALQAFTLTANWTRFETTATVTLGLNSFQIGSRGAFTTDNSVSVDLWGAQLELGAFATSYIPTSSASVTRNADTITKSNVFTNGYITSAGGTWFVELRNNVTLSRDASAGGLTLNTGTLPTAGNGFTIRNATTPSRLAILKLIADVGTSIYTTTTDTTKIAIKWGGTTADVFVNGVKVVSATAFTPTAMENLSGLGTNVSLNINQMQLYTTPLSDTELISLTTL